MSAKQLCDALAAAGFDSDVPLDPESLESAFLQGDDSRRMLAWVCARLRPANVLSATDLALYEQLEMEGKLLEGEDLDFAFDSISAFSDNGENKEDTFFWEESLEDIRDSKHALRAEVADLEKQLASLEWKLDLLTAQATTITQGKKSRSSAKTCANRQLTGLDEKLSKRSLEMNAVLGKLAATTQEVSYYHSEADIGVYLSYCDFQSYGPLQLVVKEDTSRGDSVNSHHFIVELNRINSIFAKSKRQYIEAQIEYAKEEAILSKLRTQLASQQPYIHQDSHSLRRKNSELAEELKDLSLQMQKCLSETITGLCADLALLEGANILQGDHKLKLMRQECYISHQKKFINHLVNQLVAHQFLKIACQLEKRTKISSAYSLLKAIELELQSYLSVVNGRLDRYHSIDQAASEMFEEGSVDDRDSFLHAVRDILSSHSSSQAVPPTYVSSYGLIEQISELQDELHYLQHEVENVLPRERGRCVDELCGMIQTVEQILSVPLSDEQPKLTPWPLVQSLQELEIISQQVSGSVNEVTVARNENAEILKQSSRNTHQERRVFVDFFCHPRRLENQVKELVSRVRALPE
ncbi:AUGMIN subunit 3-like isoform X2 [Phragmites australis]|uniref:AUGMIN subunit 3-like isoform X2 n=1 Tax=Phragmites australis TaxID=29695 RepID=UPI002D7834D5|nr:AUGMIN subunit 3-like isoform X2 [Phragmites australis]